MTRQPTPTPTPPTAPARDQRQLRRNLTLSDGYMDAARRLGGGNASLGVRRALDLAAGRPGRKGPAEPPEHQ